MKSIGLATLRPRERRLALVAAVVVGFWTVTSWVVQPLWERVRELRLQIDTKTEHLEAVGRLLEQAPSFEQERATFAAYLEATDPEGARVSFLDELEALARSSNVRLNLKPRPIKQDAHLSRFEVEVEAEGSQSALLSFLDALLQMPKLITVERLRIASLPAKSDFLRANLVIHQLTIH